MCYVHIRSFFFFFNDTATTEIYTLSLHDALPISRARGWCSPPGPERRSSYDEFVRGDHWDYRVLDVRQAGDDKDRKSTRLNSSHSQISYAVFCLKKKKKKYRRRTH